MKDNNDSSKNWSTYLDRLPELTVPLLKVQITMMAPVMVAVLLVYQF